MTGATHRRPTDPVLRALVILGVILSIAIAVTLVAGAR